MISMPSIRRRSLFGLAAGAVLPFAAPARAASATACGLTVLTVGGLVGAPNRAPFDPERDRFFNHCNLAFKQARAFDAAALARLPQETVTADIYGKQAVCTGPRLHGVLAAANPLSEAKTARLTALDGYAAEIPLADIEDQQWILAMEANGQPVAIGDFGPLFAMRQLASKQAKTAEEEMKWVHSLFYIELAA